MKKFTNVVSKASGLVLLAFCFSTVSYTQQIKSLSGANSPQDDMNPVWIGDNTLLFTRAYHPRNVGGVKDSGDIWMTKKSANGEWLPAVHQAGLSTDGYDFALGLEFVNTLLVYHSGGDRFGICQYLKLGTDWSFMGKTSMKGLAGLQGRLSGRVAPGGNLIFLSGKAKDSFGNEDIYVSQKLSTLEWGNPVNLGESINTKGQEMSPYYDVNSKILYFSSNMHENAVGKDIYSSKKIGDSWENWSKPKIWTQISSAGSDVSVTFISKDEVVWTSTQNSDGFADLLTFDDPVPLNIPGGFDTTIVEPQPMQKATTEARSVQVEPSYPKTIAGEPEVELKEVEEPKEDLEPAPAISWFVVDAKNKSLLPFSISWKEGGRKSKATSNDSLRKSGLVNAGVTEVKVLAKGYFPNTVPVNQILVDQPTVVLMTKAESGNIVLLDNVNFKRGTAELEGGDTMASLGELATFLKENPEIHLRIHGHTDNAGDPGLNKALSLERAGAVRDFLVGEGVPFGNLRISGWGGTRPFASNATEDGRAKNRRVELEVAR